MGYAPAEDPKLVVCVIVEEGGSGGRTAGPIAKKLFDAYLIPETGFLETAGKRIPFSSGRDRIENDREAGKTGGGKDTYPGKRGVTI